MKPALLIAALAACSLNRTVLEGAVIDCTQALHGGANGDPCSLDGTCSDATDCCTTTAYCRDGSLVVDKECNPDCTQCNDDSGCTFGAAICTNHRCVPCGDACPVATSCPVGWPHLSRNGCPQCACAPAATCNIAGAQCPTGVCYRGAVCAAGCDAIDPDCCDDQCAELVHDVCGECVHVRRRSVVVHCRLRGRPLHVVRGTALHHGTVAVTQFAAPTGEPPIVRPSSSFVAAPLQFFAMN